MTETAAENFLSPEPIFTADEALDSLWVKAYQGEVLGEALFGTLANALSDGDHRQKMEVLSKLERRTKEAMVDAMQRAGLPTDPDPDMLTLAEALSEGAADDRWGELMASFEPITTQYSDMYQRIGELDPAEQATADLLVAHELALRNFGRKELAGDVTGSLDDILALPHLQ